MSSLATRLGRATPRKLARWTVDRLRDALRRARWHAARLRMRFLDAVPIAGRLPPGSLAADSIERAAADDRFYMDQARRHGPLFKLFWGSGDLKVGVVGFPLGRRLFSRHRASLHPVSTDITELVPGDYLRAMQPDIHPHYRRLFKAALGDDLVDACAGELRAIVRDELAGLARRPAAEPGAADELVAALNRITTRALLHVVLGVPRESPLVPALIPLFLRMGPGGYVAEIGPGQRAAYPEIRARVLDVVAAARDEADATYGDSILRRIVRGVDPGAVDETVLGNAIYMVERGRHDLRDLLRWIVRYLTDHPDFTAELRASLAGADRATAPGAVPGLAEACVLETLRLDQAEVLNRRVMEPFEFEGYRMPRGTWMSFMVRESHRNAAAFEEPDAFRPQRFQGCPFSADVYAPFGIDEHQCIGRHLTMCLAVTFVEELVGGYTWTVTGDGPRQYGHFHWQPSSRFAIALEPLRAQPPGSRGSRLVPSSEMPRA